MFKIICEECGAEDTIFKNNEQDIVSALGHILIIPDTTERLTTLSIECLVCGHEIWG